MPRIAIFVNPRAGGRRTPAVAERVQMARAALRDHGADGEVTVSAGPGHGRETARTLVRQGAEVVVVWGGDGTVNEVASGLVGGATALGIVPAGSGNGLARELGLSMDPGRALRAALRGPVRRIDAGELGGRLFFNVAGVGFDATLAAAFNARARRGAAGYWAAALRAARRHAPARYDLTADGAGVSCPALLVAVANSRQYGNGAVIAPAARPDDGQLDLVVVPPIGPLAAGWHLRRVFGGTLDRLPGVRMLRVREGKIAAGAPLTFHVDGEVATGDCSLAIAVHAGALAVRAPPPAA